MVKEIVNPNYGVNTVGQETYQEPYGGTNLGTFEFHIALTEKLINRSILNNKIMIIWQWVKGSRLFIFSIGLPQE